MMIWLFLAFGHWLRLRAWIHEWYSFYFQTSEYFDRVYPASQELRRQLDEGDWHARR